jgi:hypothetical protein
MIPLCRRHTVLYKTHHDSVRTTYAWPSSQRLPLAWWPWSQSRPVAYGSPTSLKAVRLHTHAVQYITTRSLHRRDVMVSLRANIHPSTQNAAQKTAHAMLHIKRDITKSANRDKVFCAVSMALQLSSVPLAYGHPNKHWAVREDSTTDHHTRSAQRCHSLFKTKPSSLYAERSSEASSWHIHTFIHHDKVFARPMHDPGIIKRTFSIRSPNKHWSVCHRRRYNRSPHALCTEMP